MGDVVSTEIEGLKCDKTGCGYTDREAKFDDYERYLNKPCPECGSNLLTAADLAACKVMLATADWINSVSGPVDAEKDEYLKVSVNMDGSGKPGFKIHPKEAQDDGRFEN